MAEPGWPTAVLANYTQPAAARRSWTSITLMGLEWAAPALGGASTRPHQNQEGWKETRSEVERKNTHAHSTHTQTKTLTHKHTHIASSRLAGELFSQRITAAFREKPEATDTNRNWRKLFSSS